jgi:hypothetical protein
MKSLAEGLIPIYGRSYSKRNLDYYKKFYLLFPDAEKVNTCVHNLEWSHVRRVLSVTSPEARQWYLENASKGMWSVRELDRNISSQYFERRLAAQLPANSEDIQTVSTANPLEYIKNIGNFGIPIPSKPKQLQIKNPYTAQITRNTPTAFIFLVDQSVSMKRITTLNGEQMSLAEAVARIVNNQINELVYRCIKTTEVRHYYDIAIIGYGHEVYSGWNGTLAGRDFVSPEELKNNPFKKIIVKEEKRTRKGTMIKEIEKVQWLSARCDGHWTHVHQAFDKAKALLDQWMQDHHEKDCYPPTIINITDGQFNHATREQIVQQANELKAMFTNDGNVLLWNIHITPNNLEQVMLPIGKEELKGDKYSELLYDMSSLLPTRYNQAISDIRGDAVDTRHVAMATNTDMSTLIQLMDIGTPTNISPK